MNFDNYKFRASSIGKLMTEPRSKSEPLSETCKTHLLECYIEEKYGRKKDITNKYIEKGLMVEDDAITLYSRLNKQFFKKNEIRLFNEFVCGTPDLYTGLEISAAETIIDIKSSWSIYTFFAVHTSSINKDYWWQLQSYMAVSGAKKATLAYCLINTPEVLIADEKRRLLYKVEEDETYDEACRELDKAMHFDDIPMKERVIEFPVERNEEDISKIYKKVEKCRVFLNQLETSLHPEFILAEYKQDDSLTLVTEG